MNVHVIENPLKTIKVKHAILKKNSQINNFQFNVELEPNYIDLSTGIWNVAIAQFILINNGNILSTVIDISTNLCFQTAKNPYEQFSQAETKFVPLKSIAILDLKHGRFTFDQFHPPLFFQVEKGNNYSFIVNYSEVPSLQNEKLNLEVELTFLFQRLV